MESFHDLEIAHWDHELRRDELHESSPTEWAGMSEWASCNSALRNREVHGAGLNGTKTRHATRGFSNQSVTRLLDQADSEEKLRGIAAGAGWKSRLVSLVGRHRAEREKRSR